MLGEKRAAQAVYVGIKERSLCEERKFSGNDTPETQDDLKRAGFKLVKRPIGKTDQRIKKWVRYYGFVEGYITDLVWFDREHNGVKYRGYKIHMQDGSETYILDLLLNQNTWDIWCKTAENIDFTKKINISVWHDRKDDSTAFRICQDGKTVKRRYTMEHMGDCPPAQKDELDGTWDFKAQKRYLFKRMADVVIPAIHAAKANRDPLIDDTPMSDVILDPDEGYDMNDTFNDSPRQVADRMQAPPQTARASAQISTKSSPAPVKQQGNQDDDIIPF